MYSFKTMSEIKILIAGAGITGPALAFWLGKISPKIKITIVEREGINRPLGHQIDLRGHAITLAKRMGLENTIKQNTVEEKGSRLMNSNGKVVAALKTVPANSAKGNRQSISTEYEMMRGSLCALLIKETEDKVTYKYETFITSFDQDEDGVNVTFNDQTQERFDLVIGADGLGSSVRKMMIKDEESSQTVYRPIGLYIAYFDLPRIQSDENWFSFYLAPGRRLMTMRGNDVKRHQVILTIADRNPETDQLAQLINSHAPTKQLQQEWAKLYQDAGWNGKRIANDLIAEDRVDNFYSHQLAQIQMEKWYSGRIALVGDSAWCLTPFAGIGTSIGFVGAYVLAGEIARSTKLGTPLSQAFPEYDQKMRPYVAQAAKRVTDYNKGPFPPQSSFGISIIQTLFKLVTITKLDRLLGKMTSDEIAWDLPDYPELI